MLFGKQAFRRHTHARIPATCKEIFQKDSLASLSKLEWYTNPVLPVPSIGTGPVSEPGYFYQNHRNHTVKLFLVVFELLQTISMEISKYTDNF